MAQITLRGMDPALEKEIRRIAKISGKSLNRVVQEMIGRSAGPDKKSPASSLKKLAGGWSENEADEFLNSIESSEQIDEETWR